MRKAIDLIREYFGASNQEMLKLTKDERAQLATGIAVQQGIPPDACEFQFAAY